MSAHLSTAPNTFAVAPAPQSVADASPAARGFAALDERLTESATDASGVILACTSSGEAATALAAHLARRVRARGFVTVQARARAGAPLWREVATRLGLSSVDCDPARCAEQIAATATSRRAVLIVTLPSLGTWDRCVAAELALLENAPLTLLIGESAAPAPDLRVDRFDVSAQLDATERTRWWAAVAREADRTVAGHGGTAAESGLEDLSTLDAWWESARRVPVAQLNPNEEAPSAGRALLVALALAGRPWLAVDVAALGADTQAVDALTSAGVVTTDRGWITISPAWEDRANACAASPQAADSTRVAAALASRFADDPWAHARAAELLLRAGKADGAHALLDDADKEHAAAVLRADDTVARREIVSRWMREVDALPQRDQLALRIRAAERALAVGEADEAHRWAQTASAIEPNDANVTLLLGRSAVAMGDLVAAKVTLERGRASASRDDRGAVGEASALIAMELAEVAYLSGDLGTAAREAQDALARATDVATRLRARNTLGKILLNEAKWGEADRHFAEDACLAAATGDATAELRARLNRGIAFLSKGLVDEARSIFEAVLAEGERCGDARACAFALDNLSVVATWRHDYATALALSERTLKLRQRLGDRLTTARIHANLAELRRKLGLLDHAEHSIAFGRRILGPGMPPARSAHFAVVAARVALSRGHTLEARREIAKGITDSEAAGNREFLGEAHRVATRIALEDGDLAHAKEMLARAKDLATTEESLAEVALLAALHARAAGEDAEKLAESALGLARACGEEECLREAHVLLCEIHRTAASSHSARLGTARHHLEQAILLRDQIADPLPSDVRAAYLARTDVSTLARLSDALAEPEPSQSQIEPSLAHASGPSTQRAGSMRPPSATAREMVGDDPAVRGLLAAVKKIARSNSTVLVRGESGTGKELVAEALHRASDRASGPMVTVNCAALVETLLLSELFGHEKGAFTGAFARRRGRFELAEGGTLFLDEIGDISPKTQVALLRVLQERTFERVGGTAPIRVNVRIICATHRDLRAMVERGEFREDLYYRLRGITLEVPALRLRMGDLARIAENLLGRIAVERGEPAKGLLPDALVLLGRHKWPGNVRELENVLRAASLFADDGVISATNLIENVDDLRLIAASVRPSDRPSPIPSVPALASVLALSSFALPGDSANELDADDLSADGEAPLPPSEASATAVAYAQVRQGAVSLADMKRQIERDCIARALAETKGNITRAAALLGMKRPRLSQLVKQYGLAAVSSEGL